MQTTTTTTKTDNSNDHEYLDFLSRFKTRATGRLFTTNAAGLFAAYLAALPESQRQHHNCNTCRHFFDHFGGLVEIDDAGTTSSAFFRDDDTPEFAALAKIVRSAKVTGVFLTSNGRLGTAQTNKGGTWHHLHANTPIECNWFAGSGKSAGEAMAEKAEDVKNVRRALVEVSAEALTQALRVLDSGTLYRSEKVRGPVKWLHDLHSKWMPDPKAPRVGHPATRENALWAAVAAAPAGFCHPRASMAWTLLEDIAAGMDYDTVSARFAAKMHPLGYQRPQAAPTSANIKQAEKLMEKIGAAGALRRRFAKLEDLQPLWVPRPSAATDEPAKGVFSHLVAKDAAKLRSLDIPPVTMTWSRFRAEVLPAAERIEFLVRSRDNFVTATAAVDPEAPLVFQWPNAVAWYLYAGGSSASQYGLTAGEFREVSAVCFKPSMWADETNAQHGFGVWFILKGAADSQNRSLGLFPEVMRSEFHGIRGTIEEFSHAGRLEGKEEASSCGVALDAGPGRNWQAGVRVTSAGNVTNYILDRWE